MKQNWQTYLIIGFFIIILFLFVKMNKTMNLQTTLLIGMAGKMGFKAETEKEVEEEEEAQEETPEEKELREENELVEAMIVISNKVNEHEPISKKEKKYYSDNFGDMHDDLQLADPSEAMLDITKPEGTPDKKLKKDEKKALVLTFFEDETPKQLMLVAELLAKSAGIEPNKGNTHTLLKKMIAENTIDTFEAKGNKVYYILPDWKDGKKLKKEFLKNIK